MIIGHCPLLLKWRKPLKSGLLKSRIHCIGSYNRIMQNCTRKKNFKISACKSFRLESLGFTLIDFKTPKKFDGSVHKYGQNKIVKKETRNINGISRINFLYFVFSKFSITKKKVIVLLVFVLRFPHREGLATTFGRLMAF